MAIVPSHQEGLMDEESGFSIELKGCIARLSNIMLSGQKEFVEVCQLVETHRREAKKQLLECAPEGLHKLLIPLMHSLFEYNKTSFQMKCWNARHAAVKASMINYLAQAWRGAVDVDTQIDMKGRRTIITVHLYAHKEAS